jgi:hypothetical protein
MAYNLQFDAETFGGHVPFIDSDHTRYIRGGLTVDAQYVQNNLAPLVNNGLVVNNVLQAGAYLGLNEGTGKYDVFVPPTAWVAASLVLWPTEAYEITITADVAGAAGNDIQVRVIDPSAHSAGDTDLFVEYDAAAGLITVVLGLDTGSIDDAKNLSDVVATAINVAAGADVTAVATGSARVADDLDWTNLAGGIDGNTATPAALKTGDVAAETGILWTHVTPGVGGNAISIEYINTGAANEAFAVAIPGGDIVVTLRTDAAANLDMNAADLVAAIIADATAAGIAAPELVSPIGNGIVQPMAATSMAGGRNQGVANIIGRYAAILCNDVDFSDGFIDAVANGIDHGRVITARLPFAPTGDVITALPGVVFK